MAEALEAMGFPSELCERALSSSTGLETAVDLLLQWQAHGEPQAGAGASSSGVMQRQGEFNCPPAASPTLRLVPLPAARADAEERDHSMSPSSALDDVSREAGSSAECARPSKDGACSSNERGSGGQGESRWAERAAAIEVSGVEGSSNRGGRPGHSDTLDSSDAVVPDAYAEERKARYLAARRAKQEKEEEKARIRQHMEEDMKIRRFRRSYRSVPEGDAAAKPSAPSTDERNGPGSSSQSRVVSMDSAVELQIRCPANHIMKATFTAGTTLKEVRAYVERELQLPSQAASPLDRPSRVGPNSVPFTGQSARLSTDRQAERELLRIARENFEIQTNRIFASAKMLRSASEEPETSTGQNKESAMDSTLADAQLVPRGTLVVQRFPSEEHQPRSVDPQPENPLARRDEERIPEIAGARVGGRQTAEASTHEEPARASVRGPDVDNFHLTGSLHLGNTGPSSKPAEVEPTKSGRTLEMEGERVRQRECALQAAAKRMKEAAKLFHAGLPLEEGETGEAFHFPRDGENQSPMNEDSLLSPQPAEQLNAFESLPDDNLSVNGDALGANAGLLDAQVPTDLHAPGPSEAERQVDALHSRVRAAAERRSRSLHPEVNAAPPNDGGIREPEGVETSRFGLDESEPHPVRCRTRIPQSSRLLSRPEKVQRTSMSLASSSAVPQEPLNCTDQQVGGRSDRHPPRLSIGGPSRAGPLEAALQRCKAAIEVHSKGKAIVEEPVPPTISVPSSSQHGESRRATSSLRVHLEDGRLQNYTFGSDTTLRLVRDAIVPEGAAASDYGIAVSFPEPNFMEGEDLDGTLEAVGLVPGGAIHLRKVSTSGMVRQGRNLPRRRRYLEESDDDEFGTVEGMFRHLSRHVYHRPDLTYEEMMELEESIGRVHVGVPEEVITTLPTHFVKARASSASASASTADGRGGEFEAEELDTCIVCMEKMMDGEEALSLPCVHVFHTTCIRKWLHQATFCPTCKQTLV